MRPVARILDGRPFAMRKFGVIYADPPWLFTRWSTDPAVLNASAGRRVRPIPYPCMPTRDICALPVQSISANTCVLFLWTIYPKLPDAFEVIKAWGFTYKTCAFTWVKRNPSGTGFSFGLGYWTRANPELCLLATRGQPKRLSKSVPNLIISPRREHSRKPDEVRDRIVQLCGDVPRAELFARQKLPGWSAWGNEVESDISLPTSGSKT
jgi:site-specific DNA-methyltransferase (adenine-specific)